MTKQFEKIIDYCSKHGSITIREAFENLHINSPSKRISELRQLGVDVRRITEESINSHGEKKRYKRYFITEGVVA